VRIISGKYKGKKLKEFELSSTKPTLDKVKEAIFDMLDFKCIDAKVLDLFAGTGALGIEAISRGADFTYLVDANKQAVNLIKENLQGIIGDYEIVLSDFKDFLKKTNDKFDIVFLDPPYDTNFGLEAIKMLFENNLLNDESVVIFETSLDKTVDLKEFSSNVKMKKYGTVAVYKIIKE